MINKKMIDEFSLFCEENDLKQASIQVSIPDRQLSYSGYINGDCCSGFHCFGYTFCEIKKVVKDIENNKHAKIDRLKQQTERLEA